MTAAMSKYHHVFLEKLSPQWFGLSVVDDEGVEVVPFEPDVGDAVGEGDPSGDGDPTGVGELPAVGDVTGVGAGLESGVGPTVGAGDGRGLG